MAPSHGMLSHLRFHRSPTSPAPELPSPSTLNAQSLPLTPDVASFSVDGPGSSSLPPVLPPISRVTSTDIDLGVTTNNERIGAKSPSDGRASQPARASYNAGSSFIGGVAWRKYRRDGGAQQAAGRDSLEDDSITQGSKPIPIQTDLPTRSAPAPAPAPALHRLKDAKSMTSFSTSYSSQNSSTISHRPPSSRLGTEFLLPVTTVTGNEPQKGKKGLPFLKNPMSTLLLRRKANQNGRNKLPISLDSSAEEPAYDPRIKGTRVHDFSAPRRQSNVPTISQQPTTAIPAALPASQGRPLPSQMANSFESPQEEQQRDLSNVPDSQRLQLTSALPHGLQEPNASSVAEPAASTAEDEPPPQVPPKDNAPSVQTTPLKTSGLRTQEVDTTPKVLGSSQTARSRSVSLSTIPRHMKSTSSRFSFDMIGAAKQEKILEERHRQRELEKKAVVGNAPRTSMYDEYDEDDFDYDAMMDDDGLEERIPGVNADDDDDQFVVDGNFDDGNFDNGNFDDDADPDNDQENFAGFVFQRSNPGSSMQRSRATTSSVRTLENGYDESTRQDEPRAIPAESQGLYLTPEIRINASDSLYDGQTTNLVQQAAVSRDFRGDDLYFGGDMTGFEDEFAEDLAAEPAGDGVPFDESIFDDNDTDQFGRPLPGAFALAQSLRRAANQDLANHATSNISRLSTQPSLPSSTAPAHASLLGVDSSQPSQEAVLDQKDEKVEEEKMEKRREEEDEKEDSPISCRQTGPGALMPTTSDGDAVAAYQAALAAAAHKAAASGKFERSTSPRADEADDRVESYLDPTFAEGEYDDYGYVDDGLDDYELDDDAIIAEANASALANDTDGWYGQEFGFYSAPVNHHASQNANKESFGYANGGFFGPKGMSGLGRTPSGRIVSREPNLTPITERSEYSNRNSLMSLVIPNVNSGTPTFQGPGLAQLQMMADRGDDMTLSALLRLRSRAFGGSSVSLASSKDGSPRSEWGDASSPRTGTFAGHFAGPNGAHGRKNSVFSIVGRDSDGGSGSGSPILKLAIPSMPNLSSMETTVVSPDTNQNVADGNSTQFVPQGSRDAPLVMACTGDGREAPASSVSRSSSNSLGLAPDGSSPIISYALTGHQRRKDSADSISYRQERDSGDTRWVMERRRTGEFGQVEVVEREIVEGGRI